MSCYGIMLYHIGLYHMTLYYIALHHNMFYMYQGAPVSRTVNARTKTLGFKTFFGNPEIYLNLRGSHIELLKRQRKGRITKRLCA